MTLKIVQHNKVQAMKIPVWNVKKQLVLKVYVVDLNWYPEKITVCSSAIEN